MITNLPIAFSNLLSSDKRSPVQIAKFTLPNGSYYYLGDRELHFGAYTIHPWIESWGTLNDSVNITDIFKGDSLEIRSCAISLIDSIESATFVKEMQSLGIENTLVELYQSFEGLDISEWVLIDTMVCQDPITVSEASMLLSIDLVSTVMQSNPYLFSREPGESKLPVVIGKALGVPLIDLQTSRWTDLVEDIGDGTDTVPTTGEFLIRNGIGFPGSGDMYIDSELVSYSSISAAGIVISARAQGGTNLSKHLVGARLTIPNALYDYAICAGPVQLVDNILANGEPYENDVTLLYTQDPVIARFTHRPPWLKVTITDGGDTQPPNETIYSQYGSATEEAVNDGAPYPTGDSNINQASGYATMAMSDKVGGGWVYDYSLNASVYTGIITSGNVYDFPTPTDWQTKLNYTPTTRELEGEFKTIGDLYPYDGVSGFVVYSLWAFGTIPPGITQVANVKIDLSTLNKVTARRTDTRARYYFRSGSGAETLLFDYTYLNYSGGSSIGYIHDGVYPVNASSINDIVDGGIRLDMVNIRSDTTNIYSPIGSLKADVSKFIFDYFVPAGTVNVPWQELVSRFNTDLTSLGAIANVWVTVSLSSSTNCTGTIEIVKRSTSNPNDNITIATAPLGQSYQSARINIMSGGSWATLQNMRVGVRSKITGPTTEGTTRNLTTYINWVKWDIEYIPGAIPNPDEARVVYADEVTCDVTSTMGANVTPPQMIRNFIESYVPNGISYIDNISFDTLHADYIAESYFLNGVIDGGMRLHDGLRKILYEGMLRFLFNEGKIKLLSYKTEADPSIDYTVVDSDTFIKSMKIENQPISTIKNDVDIVYKKNLATDVYDGKYRIEDPTSISLFTRQEERRGYDLINSDTIAILIADRTLSLFKMPVDVYEISVFMPPGYILEKGDRIQARAFNDKRVTINGNILSISRRFAEGKNKLINRYTISIANPLTSYDLVLDDDVILDDITGLATIGFVIPPEDLVMDDSEHGYELISNLPEENLGINEEAVFTLCVQDGYGTCGYGVFKYGD